MRVGIVPQDESKCVQASGAQELAVPSDSWRATTCRVPRLHWGQDRFSADFCGSGERAHASIVVTWSRFKPWGGVGGMSAGG